MAELRGVFTLSRDDSLVMTPARLDFLFLASQITVIHRVMAKLSSAITRKMIFIEI